MRVFSTLVASLLILLISGEYSMAISIDTFKEALPAEIDGWKLADDPAAYDKTTLYEYIDGGAELFIAYGFKTLYSFRYTSVEDEEIVIDVFDMGNSYDAYGVFSHRREADDKNIGQGSEYSSGLLTFWKDRYYVSILAYPETGNKARIVKELGSSLADVISGTGDLPPILLLLPEEHIVPESIHYFHHPVLLNSRYFVSNDNILNIGDDTPSVMAKYRMDGCHIFMLLVRYPDERKAQNAHRSSLRNFFPDSPGGMLKSENGTWSGCRVKGRLLAVVFDAPAKEALISFLDKAVAGEH